MRSPFLDSPHRAAALVARAAGVVVLMPLILLAGIVAVAVIVAMTATGVGRRPAHRPRPAQRRAPSRAVVLRLEPAAVEHALGRAGSRAA
jgi:hypothetical protein